jgi:hypothetical protein
MVYGTVSSKKELENLALNQYLQGSDIIRQTEKLRNGSTHIGDLEANLNHSKNSSNGTTKGLTAS